MSNDELRPLSPEELAAETGAALPDKEVMSLLDLNADLNIALDAAAPIDLGVAANANAAAPIEASIGANVLSAGSTAVAGAHQARRHRPGHHRRLGGPRAAGQLDRPDRGRGSRRRPTPRPRRWPRSPPPSSGPLDGPLLNVDVNLDGKLEPGRPDRRRGGRAGQRRGPDRCLGRGERRLDRLGRGRLVRPDRR